MGYREKYSHTKIHIGADSMLFIHDNGRSAYRYMYFVSTRKWVPIDFASYRINTSRFTIFELKAKICSYLPY